MKARESWSHLKLGLVPLFISGSLTGDEDTRVPVKPILANITEPMKIEEAKTKILTR